MWLKKLVKLKVYKNLKAFFGIFLAPLFWQQNAEETVDPSNIHKSVLSSTDENPLLTQLLTIFLDDTIRLYCCRYFTT